MSEAASTTSAEGWFQFHEEAQQIVPFYFVCDLSPSMEPYIKALNDSISRLHIKIGGGAKGKVDAMARLSIIGFADDATVIQPLIQLGNVLSLPRLLSGGRGTNYTSALNLLHDTILSDVAAAKSRGDSVCRPVVFFLTDGEPQDDWLPAHQRVTSKSFRYPPTFFAFGFGKAKDETMGRLATALAYVHQGAGDPADFIADFMEMFGRTIISTRPSPEGDGGVVIDLPPELAPQEPEAAAESAAEVPSAPQPQRPWRVVLPRL